MVEVFFQALYHSFLVVMTLWSLLKTMLSDPGYLPYNYHVRT